MAWNKLNCLVISIALQSLALCCFSGKIQLWWRRMASEWCNRIIWFGIWDRPASFACSQNSVHHKDMTLLQNKVAFSAHKQELCTFYFQMWWNIIQRKAHYVFFFFRIIFQAESETIYTCSRIVNNLCVLFFHQEVTGTLLMPRLVFIHILHKRLEPFWFLTSGVLA